MAKTLTIAPKGGAKGRGRGAGKRRSIWREYAFFVLVVVGLALLVRFFLVQAYLIPSRSMEDTLLVGDYLLVDKFTYGVSIPFIHWRLPGLRAPRPKDMILFRYPLDPERIYIKRCIAVAGQVVEIRNKVMYVDGSRVTDPAYSKYVDARILPSGHGPRDNYGPKEVPVGTIFVVGDNRDNSRDSRHWGFLPRERIVGRALCVYWSCEPAYDAGQTGLSGTLPRLASLPQRIRWSRLGNWVE